MRRRGRGRRLAAHPHVAERRTGEAPVPRNGNGSANDIARREVIHSALGEEPIT